MRIAGFAWFLSGFVGAGYRAFTGCPQRPGAGPAGLRGLLKSPPRLAGQAPSALRATRFNPARGRPALNLPKKNGRRIAPTPMKMNVVPFLFFNQAGAEYTTLNLDGHSVHALS
jgi:hypothetical protein